MLLTKTQPAGLNTSIAYQQLRELILSGDLGPGTDHLESELAERLGMSRTPVREALLRLEAHGLIVVRPRKGARIVAMSADDVVEVFDLLAEIEGLAASKAASNGLSADDLAPLTKAITAMEEANAADQRDAWSISDDAYHHGLAVLSGSRRLAEMSHSLIGQVHRARLALIYLQPPAPEIPRQHKRVCEAILSGDASSASQFQRAHRLAAKETAIQLMERHRLISI